jgi:hypothetical protein
LDYYALETIRQLRFANQAELFFGARDATEIEGISGLSRESGTFDLAVIQQQDRWIFSFHDKEGHSGGPTVNLPPSVSTFEIDPREEEPTQEGGSGPRLYKEWKMTAKAVGTGIFSNGMGSYQRITLILQGHGNSCTTSEDLTAWTLVMNGLRG